MQRLSLPFLLFLLILLSGFLIFPPMLVVAQILLGAALWSTLAKSSWPKSDRPISFFSPAMIGVASVIFLARLFPFLLSSTPLGYDTGIYRYEFWSSFQALPEYASGLFLGLPLLTNVLQMFGLSVDGVLVGAYVALALLVPLVLMLLAGFQRRNFLLLTLALFALSLVQWQAFSMLLFKQILALSLIVFSFWLLNKRSWLVFLPLGFLALLQPLDAFLVGLSIALYALWSLVARADDRRFFVSLMFLGLAAASFLIALDPGFWQQALVTFLVGLRDSTALEASLQEGVFMSLESYGVQASCFFVLGVLGWCLEIRDRRGGSLTMYFLLLWLWIVFGLFFHQRLLIQWDLVLILYSAAALYRLVQHLSHERFLAPFLGLLAASLLIPFAVTLKSYQPLIGDAERERFVDFCHRLPANTLIAATDASYAPWLRGYCLDQRVIAPGLFEHNRWSREDWEAFWRQNQAKIPELLSRYSETVYWYVGEQQYFQNPDPQWFEWQEGGWYKSE